MDIKFTELTKFQPKQLEAWHALMSDECKYFMYGGAASGGKSYFLRWASIGLAMYYFAKYGIRNVPIGLFSEDYPTLKDRQITRIKREIPLWIGELKDSRDEGYVFKLRDNYGGGSIMLRNLDDPSKYSSVEFASILVEEVTKNPRQTFDDLRFRLRYPGVPDPKFVSATNPGGVGHGWVRSLFVDKNTNDPEQDRFKFVQALYSDNKFIDPTYVEQLKGLPEDKRRAFMDGSWDVFAGQFFTIFDRVKHVCRPFIPSKNWVFVGGMDWGRTAPFGFILSAIEIVNFEGIEFNRQWLITEVYGTQKTPKEWATEIKNKLIRYNLTPSDIEWIRGDPAMFTKGNDNSMSISDQFKNEGIDIKPASNDRIGGWENLQNWLSIAPDGKPYAIISEDCPNLIRTLPELVHDETKVEDVDTLGEDHLSDGWRYLSKNLKWVDAKLGRINRPGSKKEEKFTAQTRDGRQISINLEDFSKVNLR